MKALCGGILLLSLLPFSAPARSQANLTALPPTAAVGDPVTLRVIVQTDVPHDSLRLETGKGNEIWQETGRRRLPRREMNGFVLEEIHVQAAFFRTGQHRVGPFRIVLQRRGQRVDEITTQAVTLTIRSVLKDSDRDIANLKPPVEVRGDPARLLPWAGGALALLLAALFALNWWRRRRRRPQPAAPPLPPLDELEQNLERLMSLGLFARGRVREFCLRLTPILKRFLSRQYGFNAEDLTTRETLAALETAETEKEIRDHFALLFNLSDQVKFARFQPGPAGEARLKSRLQDLISLYRRREETPEEPHAAPGE